MGCDAGSAAFAQERLPAALVEDTAAVADARICGSACSMVSLRLPVASRRVGAECTLRGARNGTVDQQHLVRCDAVASEQNTCEPFESEARSLPQISYIAVA